MTLKRQFKCTFCERTFVRKSWYDKHMCEKKRRFIASNDLTTIHAHRLFNHWQHRARLLRKSKEKTKEEFLKSPYYKLFMRLSEFVERTYVISAYKYLDWLVANKIPEHQWTNSDGLRDYQEYVNKTEDPQAQAESTCKNIKTWCNEKGIDPSMFFESVTPGQALNMVRANQLAPWVLFGYSPSIELLVSRMEGETLYTLDEHVNVNYWLDKVDSDSESVDRVTACCEKRLTKN